MLECLWIDQWADWLISYFDLKRSTSPLPVGFWGRKRGVDFYKTTFEIFRRIIPQNHYRFREQQQELIFRECLKFHVGGLDNRETISKFNSAEYCVIAIDQAEETTRQDVGVLQGAMRLTHNGKTPPYKELYTANPAECWLKEDFIDNKQPEHYFIPALFKDNPHLPGSYEHTLRTAFRYNPAFLRAYLDGDWYAIQADNALVSSRQMEELKHVILHPKLTRRMIACDPSLGGDECVIMALENGRILEMRVMHERDAMKIAGEMLVIGRRHNCPNFAADTTGGLGSAILDRIHEIVGAVGELFYINASEAAGNPEAYQNVRMESAWYYMTQVIDKSIPYPEDEEVRADLLAYRFQVVDSNGKTKLEDKQQIKIRIGHSPDKGDCYILGLYAQDKSAPIRQVDGWAESRTSSEVTSAAASAMAA